MPTSRRLPSLALANQNRPAARIEVWFGQGHRLADPKSRSPEDHDHARSLNPWSVSPARRMTEMISSTRGGSGG